MSEQANNAGEVEAFEDYASSDGQYYRAVEKSANGGYKLMATHSAWGTWQAAWKARGKQDAALIAELKAENDNLARALAEEVNGPTFMGEPYVGCREDLEDWKRRTLKAEAALRQASPVGEPVAWMHSNSNRYDVIHSEVKALLQKSAGHLHRPLDKSEKYSIPLYLAPPVVSANKVPDDQEGK